MALTDKLINIADAIRTKTNITETMTLDEMVTNINNIKTESILQDKEVTPTKAQQNIVADNNYDGLGTVTVKAIPDEYTIPTGTIEITENGTHDVTGYAEATVNVEGSEPVIEPDYITDGLVAWFDGEDDVDGSNHWNSRVGTDYIYQYNTSTSFNHFKMIKSEQAYKNNMTYALISSNDYYIQGYTIEVVGKAHTTASSSSPTSLSSFGATLLAFNKTATPMIQIYGTNQSFGCLNSYPEQGMPVLYKNCVGKRYKYTICLDEIQDRSTTNGYFTISYALNNLGWHTRDRKMVTNMSKNNGTTCFLSYYHDSYLPCGEINCIRVYNRKLTDEELAHNYEIDNARFKLDTYEE